jgi:D-serine deaminase-like pyridoxal phosphate-dependent protein
MAIGENIFEIDTPALWVDLDIMEANIAYLVKRLKQTGVNWRPHTKGIKIPAIAHKLVEAGAIGVTCAKLGEAEIMAAAGVKDILIANEIVGQKKIQRLVGLSAHADVMVAVDDLDNVREISSAASEAGRRIRILVELNIGMERAGLDPGHTVVDFVKETIALPGIDFAGLMGWEGHVVGITDPVEKKREGEKAIYLLVEMAEMLRREGVQVQIVSCGGSGSYPISASIPGVTEIQAGGAIFGDITYQKWGAGTEPSLFVMTSVTSHAVPQRAIVDAGRKSMNCDISMPYPNNIAGIELTGLSAEHGILKISDPNLELKVGDKVNFVVGYGDWTVFLYDRLLGVRDGKIEIVWDILGRGKLT